MTTQTIAALIATLPASGRHHLDPYGDWTPVVAGQDPASRQWWRTADGHIMTDEPVITDHTYNGGRENARRYTPMGRKSLEKLLKAWRSDTIPSEEFWGRLAAGGWRQVSGKPTMGGYRPARDGGGYEAEVRPVTWAVTLWPGTPASHEVCLIR